MPDHPTHLISTCRHCGHGNLRDSRHPFVDWRNHLQRLEILGVDDVRVGGLQQCNMALGTGIQNFLSGTSLRPHALPMPTTNSPSTVIVDMSNHSGYGRLGDAQKPVNDSRLLT